MVDPASGMTLEEARVKIPITCAKCHNAIYEIYKDSVHGDALLAHGNTDTPTCIDCHSVHNISDPTTSEFRLRSPEMCANCHTNQTLMDKYGLSTDVLTSYVADFHGTTVTIFEKTEPDQITNKPVCYDCHGIHDIAATDDPGKGIHIKQNMLKVCQKCHPDATTNFPDSWMSHYSAKPDKAPLVFYINAFYYYFLIPVVLGGMAFFVLTDIIRKLINRRKGAKQA
jgi:hypothetical protein